MLHLHGAEFQVLSDMTTSRIVRLYGPGHTGTEQGGSDPTPVSLKIESFGVWTHLDPILAPCQFPCLHSPPASQMAKRSTTVKLVYTYVIAKTG